VSGDGERVGGINTTWGLVGTVIGVMFTVLRKVGERGEDGGLASSSMAGLGSRKEAGGIKTGLSTCSPSSISRGRVPNTDCILRGL